jgi:hypothetical protein
MPVEIVLPEQCNSLKIFYFIWKCKVYKQKCREYIVQNIVTWRPKPGRMKLEYTFIARQSLNKQIPLATNMQATI